MPAKDLGESGFLRAYRKGHCHNLTVAKRTDQTSSLTISLARRLSISATFYAALNIHKLFGKANEVFDSTLSLIARKLINHVLFTCCEFLYTNFNCFSLSLQQPTGNDGIRNVLKCCIYNGNDITFPVTPKE